MSEIARLPPEELAEMQDDALPNHRGLSTAQGRQLLGHIAALQAELVFLTEALEKIAYGTFDDGYATRKDVAKAALKWLKCHG